MSGGHFWISSMQRKARLYPNRRGATIGRRYFVRRKPASRAGSPGWHALRDLYALDAA